MSHLAETPDARVVGFLDDNPALRRRRIHGVTVHGRLDDVERLLGDARFVERAPAAVVQRERERLEELRTQLTGLTGGGA